MTTGLKDILSKGPFHGIWRTAPNIRINLMPPEITLNISAADSMALPLLLLMQFFKYIHKKILDVPVQKINVKWPF